MFQKRIAASPILHPPPCPASWPDCHLFKCPPPLRRHHRSHGKGQAGIRASTRLCLHVTHQQSNSLVVGPWYSGMGWIAVRRRCCSIVGGCHWGGGGGAAMKADDAGWYLHL